MSEAKNPQRVAVERLPAKWRADTSDHSGDFYLAQEQCADELEAALPALLQQVAELGSRVNELSELNVAVQTERDRAESKLAAQAAEIADRDAQIAMIEESLRITRELARMNLALYKAASSDREAAERAREGSCGLLRDIQSLCGTQGETMKLVHGVGNPTIGDRIAAFLAANGGG